jgi:hypothetical protein
MPSTVYKGDLAEVTFGHESGLLLRSADSPGHTTGAPQGMIYTTATVPNSNTSTITFAGGIANSPVVSGILRYPLGMLVGSSLTLHGNGTHVADDYATSGQIFTIVKHELVTTVTVLTVSPTITAAGASFASDSMYIHTLNTPTLDQGSVTHAQANTANESVLTDQFLGLAATVVLPDTKNEIKRAHVVGIGRDVVVQVPGKQSNEGGSFELMMNSPRWLYYCLGGEAIKAPGTAYDVVSPTLLNAASVGDSHLDLNAITLIALGDYIAIEDTTAFDIPTDSGPTNTWSQFSSTAYNQTISTEIRRVIAMQDGVLKTVWLDSPLGFNHAGGNSLTCRVLRYTAGSATGPDVDKTTLAITNPTERLLFSNHTTPSFAVETSIRTHNVGGHAFETGVGSNIPGGAQDAKTLTRVFKGCKVKDWTLGADADSEVKLGINFDSLMVYTDTGRKETSNKGDRYTAHRMFENTANSPVNRKIAGIAPYTQKPYMFYNGEIKAFGQTMARVTKFNLTGKNNTMQHWTIRGTDIAMNTTTDQIPFAGTRMPVYAVEGKTEYELELEVIINDPMLWHDLRHTVDRDYLAPISLTLIKQGSGTVREQIQVLIDDYIISEAPLPIPEDKGVIRTNVKIMPKHVSVKSIDTLFHC